MRNSSNFSTLNSAVLEESVGNILTIRYGKENLKTTFPQRNVRRSSIGLLVASVIRITVQLAFLGCVPYNSNLSTMYCGLWCGVSFTMAGAIGLFATEWNQYTRKYWYILYMILSIGSTMFAFVMLTLSLLIVSSTSLPYCAREYVIIIGFFGGIQLCISVFETIMATVASVVSGKALHSRLYDQAPTNDSAIFFMQNISDDNANNNLSNSITIDQQSSSMNRVNSN